MIRFLLALLFLGQAAHAACTKITMPTDFAAVTNGTRANLKANFTEIETKVEPCMDSVDEIRGRFTGYSSSLLMSSLENLRLKLDSDASATGLFLVENGSGDSLFRVSEDSTAKFFGTVTLNNLTASLPLFTSSTKGITTNAMTGTGSVVMSDGATLTGTLTGATANFSGTLGATGRAAVGTAPPPNTNIALDVRSPSLTGTSQYGIYSQTSFGTGATTLGAAMGAVLVTANSAFTMTEGVGVRIESPSKGAASTITTAFGLKVENQTAGGTNYAIHTGTGKVQLGDSLVGASSRFTGTVTADSLISAKFYTEGNFTITLTGVSGTVTGTAYYIRVGKAVTLHIPALSGTSNANTATLTGIPAAITPARPWQVQMGSCTDNSAALTTPCRIDVDADAVFNLYPTMATGSWTSSGTKGIDPTTVNYTLQ